MQLLIINCFQTLNGYILASLIFFSYLCSNKTTSMKRNLPYSILLACAFFWCAFLFMPPLTLSFGFEGISHQLYHAYSPICHQYDSRSLHVFGHKLAVCSRCSAVYFGFFIGVLLYPLLNQRKSSRAIIILVAAVTPMLLDVLLDVTGLHTSNLLTRLASGSFFGILLAIVLSPSIIEAIAQNVLNRPINQKASYEFKT